MAGSGDDTLRGISNTMSMNLLEMILEQIEKAKNNKSGGLF